MTQKYKRRNRRRKQRQKKRRNEHINRFTNELIIMLKEHDFIVQRYDSQSSNSVYLKLDHGVANSIRISDHKGKRYLSYRYNVLTICPTPISTLNKQKFNKHYFPFEKQVVLEKVLKDRKDRIEKYGSDKYKMYMENNKFQGERKKKGFWSMARIV